MSLFRKVPNSRTDVWVNKVDKHVHTNIFRIFNILESREVAFSETSLIKLFLRTLGSEDMSEDIGNQLDAKFIQLLIDLINLE